MKAYVYILTTIENTTLYTGVTSDLEDRIHKHKTAFYKGSFTHSYNVTKLVYYEVFDTMLDAIKREKQIKAGSRARKVALINTMNPEWNDLSVILQA